MPRLVEALLKNFSKGPSSFSDSKIRWHAIGHSKYVQCACEDSIFPALKLTQLLDLLPREPNGDNTSLSGGEKKGISVSYLPLGLHSRHPPNLLAMTAVELLTRPRLPVEILWEMITYLWHSSLTPQERIAFMISSHQVNRLWMNIFMRVAYTDAYITSRPHLDYFLKILRQESHVYKRFKDLPNTLCKSITVQIEHPDQRPNILADSLYMVKATRTLLNVNTLVVRYSEFFYHWEIYQDRFMDVPNSVEHLEVHFPWKRPHASQARLPVETPEWYVPNPIWRLPQVRHLSIFGTQGRDILLWYFMAACPQLHTLETEFSIEDLKSKVHRLIELPSKILSTSSSIRSLR